MNRYNPYSVPEDFFGTVRSEALAKRAKIRRNIRLSAGAFIVAAMIMAVPHLFSNVETEQIADSQQVSDNLAEMYRYDIFLQVANF